MKLKLEDVCERGSSSLKQSDILGMTGDYPIYGASGYIGNVDFYHQEKPYVAIVKDGAGIGRTTFHPAKSSVIGTMQYLLPKDNVLPKYLYYVVGHMHLEKYFSGATIPHIYFKDYKSEEFNYDSLDKQKNIVEILGRCEKVISARKRELELLDSLIKARFVEMFSGHIKEGGKPLSELAVITGGLTKNSKRETFDLKMSYLRVANVFFNRLDLNEIQKIGVKKEEIDKTLLHKGDLLFVEGNGSLEQIGRVAIWDGSIGPILHQNHLIKARFRGKTIMPEFALFYFMSQEGRQQIISKSVSTSGLNTLSVNKIGSLILPVPPIILQEQFADFVHQVDKSKVVVQKALDEAQILFDSLMQKYFG